MATSKNSAGRPRRSSTLNNTTSSSAAKPSVAKKSVTLHRSFSDRMKNKKLARSTRKAAYLSTLPKEPWKRVLYRMHPKRVAKYWFSREGGIMALKITGVGIVAGFLIVLGLFAYFRKDLPKIKDISGTKVGGSITYYDRTGQTVLWQDYDAVKRVPVKASQMADNIKLATVAIEDKDFYNHGAFDVRGIMRAGLHDITGGGGTQGGSTLTQQLVKNDQNWTYDHSYTRKLKELILAVELEREYKKDEILTGYLNIAPYGNVDRGVEAAARDYFGVSAKDLTLAQSAMLASIPKAPTLYSPYSDPKYNPAISESYFDAESLIGRQHYVLDQMVKVKIKVTDEDGKSRMVSITQKQADAAKKEDVLAQIKPLESKYNGIKAPYFVLAAKDELQQRYGAATVKLGGWKVTTTLNLDLQNLAEEQVNKGMAQVRKQGGDSAAFVAEDVKTGQIVSMVGGSDFSNDEYGKLNFGHNVKVSPGSSFKPYDAVTFINNNNNVGAGSVLYDQQGPIPGYPCTNKNSPKVDKKADCLWDYDFRYPGAITLRYALGGSRNVPWVKAMLSSVPNDNSKGKVKSINKVIDTATSLMDAPHGYVCYEPGTDVFTATKEDESQCYGSSAIGDGAYLHLDDHVNGIASLSRLGNSIPKTYILKITDANNKTLTEFQQPKGKQVVKQDAAYIVNNMAADPNASYLPSGYYKFHRYKGWDFAIKTGTTNDGFDGLMASWSSQYATVTWVGYHTRTKAMTGAMEYMTAPIERGWMQGAHDLLNKPPVNWQAPKDIKTLPAYVVRNHVGIGSVEPSTSTDLFPSWYTGGSKQANSSQVLDKVSGKLATSCTPELAKDTQANSNTQNWNVDLFNGGKPSTTSTVKTTGGTQATDDVHSCNDPPPLVSVSVAGNSCDTSCKITVTASQQAGGHPLSGGSYTTAPAGTITVTLGGQTICNLTIPSSSSDVYSDSSCTYTPTTAQQAALTAMVVDSVLFSGTSTSDTISFSPAKVAASLKFKNANYSNGTHTLKVKWSGGTGTVSVTRNGVPVCSAAADDGECEGPALTTGPDQVALTDSAGGNDSGSY